MKIHSRSGCVWGKYGHLWGGPYYKDGEEITCRLCQAIIAKRTKRRSGKRRK